MGKYRSLLEHRSALSTPVNDPTKYSAKFRRDNGSLIRAEKLRLSGSEPKNAPRSTAITCQACCGYESGAGIAGKAFRSRSPCSRIARSTGSPASAPSGRAATGAPRISTVGGPRDAPGLAALGITDLHGHTTPRAFFFSMACWLSSRTEILTLPRRERSPTSRPCIHNHTGWFLPYGVVFSSAWIGQSGRSVRSATVASHDLDLRGTVASWR
jgi:hypothetical protein